MENLFVIDGVRQSREDLARRWNGSFAVVDIRGEEKLICFRDFGDEIINYYVQDGARMLTENGANVFLKREFPETFVTNYTSRGDSAVLLLSRTGERQWSRGLNRNAFHILYVAGPNEAEFFPDFDVSKAFFYPTFTNIKQAVNHCLHNKAISHAVSPRFWVKQVTISGQKYVGLYRKEICVGLLSDASLKSFYLQGSCSPFKREIDAVLKGLK